MTLHHHAAPTEAATAQPAKPFTLIAIFDATRVEAHLVARKATAIEVAYFKSLRTDTSWKHTPSEFDQLIAAAGWAPIMSWKDSDDAPHLIRSPLGLGQ